MKAKKAGKTLTASRRRSGEWRIEGRLKADGRLPAWQRPSWYCNKRKTAGLPFKWTRFAPGSPEVGLPTGGSTVLVAIDGFAGKLLAVPDGYLYEQTARLFRKHNVRWWSYPPPIPFGALDQTRVLGCSDFYYQARWETDEAAQ
jgi:hypothetical protein